jgi:hypothetical protein
MWYQLRVATATISHTGLRIRARNTGQYRSEDEAYGRGSGYFEGSISGEVQVELDVWIEQEAQSVDSSRLRPSVS